MPILNAALSYITDGFSVLPVRMDGTKKPAIQEWKDYQSRRMNEMEATAIWTTSHCGVAIICGEVSGRLEVLDFDKPGLVDDWFSLLSEINPELHEIVLGCRQVATQGKGRHLYLARTGRVPGNRALAHSASKFEKGGKQCSVMIETRGEGGYVVAPPTRGYTLHDGTIPVLTEEDWAVLDSVSMSFNEVSRNEHTWTGQPTGATHELPGADFQNRGPPIAEILEKHGWTRCAKGMVRPGKSPRDGISATIGKVKDKNGNESFYNFSTDAAPFEAQRSYNRFSVYAMLEHGGDFHSAAQSLRADGYGEKKPYHQAMTHQPRSMLAPATEPDESFFVEGNGGGIQLDTKLPEQAYLFETMGSTNVFGSYAEPCGVLPKGLTSMLAAEGGAGKTWALLQLALSIASGAHWLDHFRMREIGDVFLGLAEENAVAMERRLQSGAKAVGMSAETFAAARPRIDVQALSGKTVNMICRGGRTEMCGRLFDRLAKRTWSLVVLDPLSRWGGPDVENDPHVGSSFVRILEELCTLPGNPSVLVAHHTAKTSRGGVKTTSSSARGTTALSDGVRWHANLEAMEIIEGAPYLARLRIVKGNASAPLPPFPLRRIPELGGALTKATKHELAVYEAAAKENEKKHA